MYSLKLKKFKLFKKLIVYTFIEIFFNRDYLDDLYYFDIIKILFTEAINLYAWIIYYAL